MPIWIQKPARPKPRRYYVHVYQPGRYESWLRNNDVGDFVAGFRSKAAASRYAKIHATKYPLGLLIVDALAGWRSRDYRHTSAS